MVDGLIDYTIKEARETGKVIISAIFDTIKLVGLIACSWSLELVMEFFHCESEYWAKFIHNYGEPGVILTLFALWFVKIVLLVITPMIHSEYIVDQPAPFIEIGYDDDSEKDNENKK